jgi:hypothetical protein
VAAFEAGGARLVSSPALSFTEASNIRTLAVTDAVEREEKGRAAAVSLLQVALSSFTADAMDLTSVWMIILLVYGVTAIAVVGGSPIWYLMVRFGKHIDWALGIDSPPPPITAEELPAKIAELQQTMVRRCRVIAWVFAAFVAPFALLPAIIFGATDHFNGPQYVGIIVIAVLATLGEAILVVVPIGVISYFAQRSSLRHQVKPLGSLS